MQISCLCTRATSSYHHPNRECIVVYVCIAHSKSPAAPKYHRPPYMTNKFEFIYHETVAERNAWVDLVPYVRAYIYRHCVQQDMPNGHRMTGTRPCTISYATTEPQSTQCTLWYTQSEKRIGAHRGMQPPKTTCSNFDKTQCFHVRTLNLHVYIMCTAKF